MKFGHTLMMQSKLLRYLNDRLRTVEQYLFDHPENIRIVEPPVPPTAPPEEKKNDTIYL